MSIILLATAIAVLGFAQQSFGQELPPKGSNISHESEENLYHWL